MFLTSGLAFLCYTLKTLFLFQNLSLFFPRGRHHLPNPFQYTIISWLCLCCGVFVQGLCYPLATTFGGPSRAVLISWTLRLCSTGFPQSGKAMKVLRSHLLTWITTKSWDLTDSGSTWMVGIRDTQPQLFLGDTSPRVAARIELVLKGEPPAKTRFLRTGF
ncbi:hypothetical protein DL96DRAFT_1639293 [Flagelloscypha sp. PMI_526]|nr:hypothetical protein DL96DRAFT_1639293 [Flagelloscypha sp. PMI_526]